MTKLTLTRLTSSLFWLAVSVAQAQESGQVISRTPVYQQAAVPHLTCAQSPAGLPAQTSGGGAMVGAVIGGIMGRQIGAGDGLATMAGVIGGAVLGAQTERQSMPPLPQTTCATQTVYENRLIGYNVVYEYAGKQYNVQLPQDPGTTIPLQVTPLGVSRSDTTVGSMVSMPAPVTIVTEPRVVYVPAPAYRTYPPIYTHINLGWGWDHRRNRWR